MRKRRIEQLCEPKVRAAVLRSKAQFYEEGEKPTKFFCNPEKSKCISKVISGLNIDGKITTTQKKYSCFKNYYSKIYKFKLGNQNLTMFVGQKHH